ncbi:MAG: hypothetical protein LJE64_09670 [Desulfofustis sp.]|jgi:hypothetical protein|nr:hypothetical protein [Desulfofustis sp.]
MIPMNAIWRPAPASSLVHPLKSLSCIDTVALWNREVNSYSGAVGAAVGSEARQEMVIIVMATVPGPFGSECVAVFDRILS